MHPVEKSVLLWLLSRPWSTPAEVITGVVQASSGEIEGASVLSALRRLRASGAVMWRQTTDGDFSFPEYRVAEDD